MSGAHPDAESPASLRLQGSWEGCLLQRGWVLHASEPLGGCCSNLSVSRPPPLYCCWRLDLRGRDSTETFDRANQQDYPVHEIPRVMSYDLTLTLMCCDACHLGYYPCPESCHPQPLPNQAVVFKKNVLCVVDESPLRSECVPCCGASQQLCRMRRLQHE